jgi:hypothetical protein
MIFYNKINNWKKEEKETRGKKPSCWFAMFLLNFFSLHWTYFSENFSSHPPWFFFPSRISVFTHAKVNFGIYESEYSQRFQYFRKHFPTALFRKLISEGKRYRVETSSLSFIHLHTQSLHLLQSKTVLHHLWLKCKIWSLSNRINTHWSIVRINTHWSIDIR